MDRPVEQKIGRPPRGWRKLAAWGLVLLCLGAVPASALVVTVDLGWGYNQNAGGNSLVPYNLQEGSIVQVIMYDSSVYSAPGVDADDNFDIIGYYPGGVLPDNTVYDPTTAPDGHLITYTASVQAAPYLDDNGNTWWQIYAQFEVIGTYDALYIRVFEMTDFSQGSPTASYWGLSDVQYGTNIVGTWYVGPLDETEASSGPNYFEVIPEPGTMALVVAGGAGLLAGARRRRKRFPTG